MKSVVRIGTETFSTHRKQEPVLKLPSHVGFTSIPTPGGNSQKFPTRYTGRGLSLSYLPSAAVLIMAGAAFFILRKALQPIHHQKISAQSDLLVSPPLDTAAWFMPPQDRTKKFPTRYAGRNLSSGGGGDHEKFVAPEEENSFRNPFRLWKAREIFVVSGPFGDDLCVTLLIPSLNPNITFFSPKNKGKKSLFFRPHSIFRRETPVRRGRTVC